MRLLDLGELKGPLLIFGGPYSNLQATEALRIEADRLGLGPEQVLCTGDILAYCGQPQETLARVRDWGIPVVQGNCESSLGAAALDCGCGFDEGSTCSKLAAHWYRYSLSQTGADERRWMSALPEQIQFTFQGRRVLCVHGDIEVQNRFVFASSSTEEKQRQLAVSGADIIIAGHSGIPFGQVLDGKAWLNSGVIGMPANDGTCEGWYLLLEEAGEQIEARWQRLSYDHPAAQQAMDNAGLPHDYRDALASGIWPSIDILPEVEKTQAAQPVELASLSF